MHIYDFINKGGTIMYILLALNMIGYAIMLIKLIKLMGIKRRSAVFFTKEIMVNMHKKKVNTNSNDALIKMLQDELNISMNKMETGLTTVRIIATVAPLLGLLGTVIGILNAFMTVSKSGLDDPSAFAGGISLALITTIGGLIVAIPHNIGYNYLNNIIDGIEVNLEAELLPQVLKMK